LGVLKFNWIVPISAFREIGGRVSFVVADESPLSVLSALEWSFLGQEDLRMRLHVMPNDDSHSTGIPCDIMPL